MKRLLRIAGLSVAGAVGATAILVWPLPVPDAEGAPYQELPKLQYSEHPNRHAISQVPRRIGIIGGGASGLITAKVLKQQGYSVEILEKREHYGGVWYRNYEGAGLQDPYYTYDMPDHYFPQGTTLLPKQDEILKFFDRYVDQFSLKENLRVNSEVRNIRQLQNETWRVTLANGSQLNYDFLVLCNGSYHSPSVPNFPGFDSFKGRILHSSQLTNAKQVCEGKKVVVVGGGKSALDILNVASEYAQSTTGLVRKIHHTIADDFQLFGLQAEHLMYSRAADLLTLPAYCENQLPYMFLSPIGNLYWLFMGKMLSADLPEFAKPTVPLREDRLWQVVGRNPNYTAKLHDGRISILPGEVERILPKGLVLKSGQTVEADVLVFATGFKRNFFGVYCESAARGGV